MNERQEPQLKLLAEPQPTIEMPLSFVDFQGKEWKVRTDLGRFHLPSDDQETFKWIVEETDTPDDYGKTLKALKTEQYIFDCVRGVQGEKERFPGEIT